MSRRPVEWEALEKVPTALEAATIKGFIQSGYDLSKLRECAIQAGSAPVNAARVGANAIRKVANNPKMQKALRKQGISFDRLARKLDELLDCKHPQYPDQPDNLSQLKAFDMAVKIKDGYPSQKIELDKTETHQIVISMEVVQAVEKAKGTKVIDVEPEKPKGYFD